MDGPSHDNQQPTDLNWHFWSLKRRRKCGQSQRSMTSRTASLVSWLTTPGKTTYSTAFRMIVRFDFEAGSRYSRVPDEDDKRDFVIRSLHRDLERGSRSRI